MNTKISSGIAICTVTNVNMAIPLENTKNRKFYAVSFPALITALTAVLVPSPEFLTRQLTGKGISSFSSPQYAARWSMSSGSLNASLVTGKPSTAVSGRMRTVCTRCLPAPIYMPLPGPEEISLLPGKGGTAPFYWVRESLSMKKIQIAPVPALGSEYSARRATHRFKLLIYSELP